MLIENNRIIIIDTIKHKIVFDLLSNWMQIGEWTYAMDDWLNFEKEELDRVFGREWWEQYRPDILRLHEASWTIRHYGNLMCEDGPLKDGKVFDV